jgi:hypothetical protein
MERQLLVDFRMDRTDRDRREAARAAAVLQWEAALRRIDDHDEPGLLAIATSDDAICEAAALERDRRSGRQAPGELRCRFCPLFSNPGECLGRLGAVNHAVLNGHWGDARRLVEEHLRALSESCGR